MANKGIIPTLKNFAYGAMPWVPILMSIGSLCCQLNELYEEVKSVPAELTLVWDYLEQLTIWLSALQRICTRDRTPTLHQNDYQQIGRLFEQCLQDMTAAKNMIESCIDSFPGKTTSWEAFKGIFSPPEWIQKQAIVDGYLEKTRRTIDTINGMILVNIYEKVSNPKHQTVLGNLDRNQDGQGSRSHRPLNSTASNRNTSNRNRRQPKTLQAPPTEDMNAQIELKARLAELSTLTNEYIWYGVPTEYQEATQSRPSRDLKGIVIQERGSGLDALRILILDMRFRRMTVLKLREGSPYFTIPSRSSAHTATILVEELNLPAPRMPLLIASSSSDSSAFANDIKGNIRISFDSTGVMRAMRSILEGYKVLHSSFCSGFRCEKIRELSEYSRAAFTILGSRENKITTVSEIIDVTIRERKLRVLLLWPFGGVNSKKWSSSKSIFYVHTILSANHYSARDKILSLKGVSLLASRNGIKSLENPDIENTVDGDFRLTFNTGEDMTKVYNLLLREE